MILPLSDAPNPRGTPWVNHTLIALNIAVYLLIALPLSHRAPDRNDPALGEYLRTMREALPRNVPLEAVVRGVSAYDLVVFTHGFRPAAPSLADLFTSLFLHGGFLHLFGNMLFLWIYGDNVEYRLGRLRYLLYYLVTGMGATVFYSLFASGSRLPLVGASGAISGVLGFYFVWFPHNTVRLFVFLFPFFMNVVTVPARIVLGIYLLMDNLLPFVFGQGGASSGVAHGAHIGGFAAGFVIAWVMDRQEVQGAPSEYRARTATRRPLASPGIADAIGRGAMEEAARLYFALAPESTRRLLKPEPSLALGDWLAANGHAEAALTVYRRHLRDYPAGPLAAEAHLGAGLVLLEEFAQVAPAYQHFLEALELGPLPETATRARAALQGIASRQKYALGNLRTVSK